MSENGNGRNGLDPSNSAENAKKEKLNDEISEMKNVSENSLKTLDETKNSVEGENEEAKRILEKKKELEMKKYIEELNSMKQKIEVLKAQKKNGKKKNEEPEFPMKNEPKKKSEIVDSTNGSNEETKEEEKSVPKNPPRRKIEKKPVEVNQSWSIFNPVSWFGGNKSSQPPKKKKKKQPIPQQKERKSLSQLVEKKTQKKQKSLFDSVGGISNQFRAMFDTSDSIKTFMLDHNPYRDWNKKDIQIWLNKIGMYQAIYPNFSKLEITSVDALEEIIREQNTAKLFEGIKDIDRMKFILFLMFAKRDEKYSPYHNKIVLKLSKFRDFLLLDPEIMFEQICLNLSDRNSVKTLLEHQIYEHQRQLNSGGSLSVPTRMEVKLVMMPTPLLRPHTLAKHLPGTLTCSDLPCPMAIIPLSLGLLIGPKTYIQWTSDGIVFIKRLSDGLKDTHLVELARLELSSLYDFPLEKIVDLIIHWNTEKTYSRTTINAVHFVDQIFESIVGEMSSNLELLSVRYVDGASTEILEPVRSEGTLEQLPFETKPIKNWSTLDLLCFYFILGTSQFFTTEFEFDLDGTSLFEADETLLQLNLLESKRMSFPKKVRFLVFHRVLMCLNSNDMRFSRKDIFIYEKFVESAVKRCVLGTSQKFRDSEVFEVDEKGWFGGTGIVNMNIIQVLPYLCSVERFESKFLSRFPLAETKVQIICLLEDHAYPIIPQKNNYLSILKKGSVSSSLSKRKSINEEEEEEKQKQQLQQQEEEEEEDDDDDDDDDIKKKTKDEFSKLMKFRTAILLNSSMLLEWRSDGLALPRMRFYRSDPRNFLLMEIPEKKDLSHPDTRKKISELFVNYIRSKVYDCGYSKEEDEVVRMMKMMINSNNNRSSFNPEEEEEKKEMKKMMNRNSQQFVDDFFKACDWNILKDINDQEEEEEEDKKISKCCVQILQNVRKNGFGIPVFEPSDEFIKYFDLPKIPFFDQFLIPNKNNNQKKKYKVVFKTHEELDCFVIELREKSGPQKDLNKFEGAETNLLMMYDRLFWHQYICYERKGGGDGEKLEMSKPKVKKVSFARKVLPTFAGGGTKGGTKGLGSDCLCPFGSPYVLKSPKNAFTKKRN